MQLRNGAEFDLADLGGTEADFDEGGTLELCNRESHGQRKLRCALAKDHAGPHQGSTSDGRAYLKWK